jgi:hypothetical protein
VIPKSVNVFAGQQFEADILPICYLPQERFSINIEGKNIGDVYNRYRYVATTKEVGKQTVKGYIKYYKSRYDTLELPFEFDYTVMANPQAVLGSK